MIKRLISRIPFMLHLLIKSLIKTKVIKMEALLFIHTMSEKRHNRDTISRPFRNIRKKLIYVHGICAMQYKKIIHQEHIHTYACTCVCMFTACAYANPRFHNYRASLQYNTIKKLFIYNTTILTKAFD
jgi:hypothetical protein